MISNYLIQCDKSSNWWCHFFMSFDTFANKAFGRDLLKKPFMRKKTWLRIGSSLIYRRNSPAGCDNIHRFDLSPEFISIAIYDFSRHKNFSETFFISFFRIWEMEVQAYLILRRIWEVSHLCSRTAISCNPLEWMNRLWNKQQGYFFYDLRQEHFKRKHVWSSFIKSV